MSIVNQNNACEALLNAASKLLASDINMDDMSIVEIKTAVVKANRPNVNLDDKSQGYIEARFDALVEEIELAIARGEREALLNTASKLLASDINMDDISTVEIMRVALQANYPAIDIDSLLKSIQSVSLPTWVGTKVTPTYMRTAVQASYPSIDIDALLKDAAKERAKLIDINLAEMSTAEIKSTVIKANCPNVDLDDKSQGYIEARFDALAEEFEAANAYMYKVY